MKDQILKSWTNALRSGSYSQTKKKLCSIEDGELCFCALGVLQDLYRKSLNIKQDEYWDYNKRENTILSMPCVNWAGLKLAVPLLKSGKSIVYLNDNADYSFSEIADAIELEGIWILN